MEECCGCRALKHQKDGSAVPNHDQVSSFQCAYSRAVTLVALASGFGLPRLVAQVQIRLGTHRALDECLVDSQHQVLNLGKRHLPFDQILYQTLR
jgi:hypothetical protein